MKLRRVAALLAGATAVIGVVRLMRERRTPAPFPASRARLLSNPIAESQARRLVELLDLSPGMRVLDYGCGPGRVTIPVADSIGAEGEVVALDVQQEMLDLLEKRAADAGVANIRTVRAAAGDGAPERDYFDRVLMVAVLGEIPPEVRPEALGEIAAALKRGGMLFVAEHLSDPHYQPKGAVRRAAEAAGLEPSSTRRTPLGYVAQFSKGGRERS